MSLYEILFLYIILYILLLLSCTGVDFYNLLACTLYLSRCIYLDISYKPTPLGRGKRNPMSESVETYERIISQYMILYRDKVRLIFGSY